MAMLPRSGREAGSALLETALLLVAVAVAAMTVVAGIGERNAGAFEQVAAAFGQPTGVGQRAPTGDGGVQHCGFTGGGASGVGKGKK